MEEGDKIINDLIQKKNNKKNVNCLWINRSTNREVWLEIKQSHYDALIDANFPLLDGKLKRKKIIRVIADCDYPGD